MAEEEDVWETILLYSGVEGYMSIKRIAKKLKVSVQTVEHRIENFRQRQPDDYAKLAESREEAKKNYRSIVRPRRMVEFNDSMSNNVKEKF